MRKLATRWVVRPLEHGYPAPKRLNLRCLASLAAHGGWQMLCAKLWEVWTCQLEPKSPHPTGSVFFGERRTKDCWTVGVSRPTSWPKTDRVARFRPHQRSNAIKKEFFWAASICSCMFSNALPSVVGTHSQVLVLRGPRCCSTYSTLKSQSAAIQRNNPKHAHK